MSAEIRKWIGKGPVERMGLAPEEPPRITSEDDKKQLPSPATPEDVVHIAKLYKESKPYMESAKIKLETREYAAA